MADNTTTNAGSGGDTFGSDDISGVKYPRVKLITGADGVNDGDVASGNPLPVSGAVTVSGVSTAANQTTGNASLSSIDGKITAVNTGAVVISSSALPSGAATAAKQPALGTAGTASADVITVQGRASMTPILTDGSATTQPVSGTITASNVTGNVAHDAVDSGNPIKIGGKGNSSVPAIVADQDRVDAWFDLYGRQVVSDYSPEIGTSVAMTSLRDKQVAQRYTVLADSLADGLATFWTATTASSGTATSTGGEGVLDTTANATGSAQLSSTTINYYPGQSAWMNSAARFNDTGSAGNTRRIGVFTVSGTTPQEGFYFELTSSGLYAVVCKGGTPTAVLSTSWSRFSISPFTLDTNYHSFEIRYTANTVSFYVDNIVRHTVSGTTSAITTTLNFPMTIQSINTSGASSRLIAVRNIGLGRFGTPPPYEAAVGSPPKFASVAASGSGNNTIVAAATGRKIRVLAVNLSANGSVNAKWQSGASGTDLTGLTYMVVNSGIVLPYNPSGWFETAASTLLNLNLSAAVAVGGSVTYIEV